MEETPEHVSYCPLSLPPEDENNSGAKLAKSVNELNDLAVAIQAFKNRYDELQKHLEFIEQAIHTRTKELRALGANSAQGTAENGVVQLDSNPKPEVTQAEEREEEEEEDELLTLCKTMNSRGLRKYVLTRLSETASLREQVPLALRSAPNPSRLVFECIGRFFLQGSKAYTKDSPMIPARQVSVLVLEYYLLSGCVGNEVDLEASLKREVDSAAVAWRKRIFVEGGLLKAAEVDARGLILFIAIFGIPTVFKDEDIYSLVSASNGREFSDALLKSQPLLKRVSDVADGMIKKGMAVKAVDLAYTFGFEEKYSPRTALTSFLQKSEETWKKAKQDARDFPSALKVAHEKYLAALKSVVNCLEGHKIDFVKLLPGWQLKNKITNLEKDIGDANKKIEEKSMLKRKVDKNNSSNKMKIPEAKRTRFTGKDASVLSPSLAILQEQRIVSHMDGNSSYDGSLSALLLDGRSYGNYPNNYLAAASISDSLAEKYLGSTVASGANMLGGAMGGSYSGYQGDMIRDNVGTVLNSNSHLYRYHGIGEGALSHDRPVGQSFVGQSASTLNNLYGKTSTEGFAGVPEHLSIGASSRSGGSDLYGFADAVFDAYWEACVLIILNKFLPAHGNTELRQEDQWLVLRCAITGIEVAVVVASNICCEATVDVVSGSCCMLKLTIPATMRWIVYANIKLGVTDSSIRKLVKLVLYPIVIVAVVVVVAPPLPSLQLWQQHQFQRHLIVDLINDYWPTSRYS